MLSATRARILEMHTLNAHARFPKWLTAYNARSGVSLQRSSFREIHTFLPLFIEYVILFSGGKDAPKKRC